MNRKLWHVLAVPCLVLLLGLAAAVGLWLSAAPPARAQGTIYVDDDNCPDFGTGTALDPYCQIQPAINAASDGDTINIAAGTYTETLTIDAITLTLTGAAAASTTIDGTGGSGHPVVEISNNSVVTITQVTILNGNATFSGGGGIRLDSDCVLVLASAMVFSDTASSGGGIYNGGTLTLSHTTVASNTVAGAGGHGGGIRNVGTLVLINSTIISNSTANGNGGGIFNAGTGILTLTDSSVAANRAQKAAVANGDGGGIYNAGNASLTGAIIKNNEANGQYGGGGIRNNGGTLQISDSTILGNRTGKDGGGIENRGAGSIVTLTKVTLLSNEAVEDGGGISTSWQGELAISGSSVDSNTAGNDGGGIYSLFGVFTMTNSTISYNGAITNGGGIHSIGTTATISGSTLYSNSAQRGGGINLNSGVLRITNSTLSGNEATDWGGGIINYDVLTVTHATIVSNTADSDKDNNGDGGGYFGGSGAVAYFKNTIIANNIDMSGQFPDCGNQGLSVNTLGYNLVEVLGGGSCTFGAPGDIVGKDPKLGPLAENGGPATSSGQATWTHALLPGSPALDAIPPLSCPVATDQRGVSRPQGGKCEIGAYEASPELTLVKSVDDETPSPGQRITYTITVYNSGAISATNALISDTLPPDLTFAGPITLYPPGAGEAGENPSKLASSLTISPGMAITVTFPVTVNTDVPSSAVITNAAIITSAETAMPRVGRVAITIARRLYLPVVLRDHP